MEKERLMVKVCGMRDAVNIDAVAKLGVDMIGFVFYEKSPRFVSMVDSLAGFLPNYTEVQFRERMNPSDSVITGCLPKRVGVFVNAIPQTIITHVYNYQLDYVQLHGQESGTMIENLRKTIDPDIRPNIKFIKALNVNTVEDIERCKEYEGVVDMFLFDASCDMGGGSGEHFNWDLLQAYAGTTPFLLSGGIGPEDADTIKLLNHPGLVGVDLNSRFEIKSGLKNVELLQEFIQTIRK
uniref:N-(5'-phosphoribosyl)anthranilate isomerase n=3 Tax=unclassified Prevotella TaxID=2638335 RepID=A0AB33JRD4_9BACT